MTGTTPAGRPASAVCSRLVHAGLEFLRSRRKHATAFIFAAPTPVPPRRISVRTVAVVHPDAMPVMVACRMGGRRRSCGNREHAADSRQKREFGEGFHRCLQFEVFCQVRRQRRSMMRGSAVRTRARRDQRDLRTESHGTPTGYLSRVSSCPPHNAPAQPSMRIDVGPSSLSLPV